jgi:hypothetical protein
MLKHVQIINELSIFLLLKNNVSYLNIFKIKNNLNNTGVYFLRNFFKLIVNGLFSKKN